MKHRCTGDNLTRGALRELPTFERGDHAGAPLLQEALQLLPGSLQHGIVLDVAAQVPVVLHEQAVPGQAASLAVRTENTHTHTVHDGDGQLVRQNETTQNNL